MRLLLLFALWWPLVGAVMVNAANWQPLHQTLVAIGCINTTSCPLGAIKPSGDCSVNASQVGSLPMVCSLSGDVLSLELSMSNLSGKLSTNLGLLSNLEVLNFATNGIFGVLPSELGRLSLLNHLSLAANPLLSGSVPTQYSLLSALTFLSLRGCSLDG
jgi:hypothetical protein